MHPFLIGMHTIKNQGCSVHQPGSTEELTEDVLAQLVVAAEAVAVQLVHGAQLRAPTQQRTSAE